MHQPHIQALVRIVRGAIYEETKDLAREELKAYLAHEATALRQENRDSSVGTQPPSTRTGP
jgi:hypothetical protein